MDISKAISREVLRPLLTLLIPGALITFCIQLWLPNLTSSLTADQSAEWIAIIFLITTLGLGAICDHIGAWIESECFDARAQAWDKKFRDRWMAYLQLSKTQSIAAAGPIVGHSYVHDRVIMLKFELGLGAAAWICAVAGIVTLGYRIASDAPAQASNESGPSSAVILGMIIALILLGRFEFKQAELSHKNLDCVREALTSVPRAAGDTQVNWRATVRFRARLMQRVAIRTFFAGDDPRGKHRDFWSSIAYWRPTKVLHTAKMLRMRLHWRTAHHAKVSDIIFILQSRSLPTPPEFVTALFQSTTIFNIDRCIRAAIACSHPEDILEAIRRKRPAPASSAFSPM